MPANNTHTSGPLLSIIIPHHNRPDMLDELLNGLPDRADLEVLVVDDRSLSMPIPTRAFQHTHLQILPTEAPTAGGARNTGIRAANGLWITFADSDDRIRGGKLGAVMDIIPALPGDVLVAPPAGFVHKLNTEGTRHRRFAQIVEAIDKGADSALLAEFVPPWSKCIRSAFIHNHGLRFSEVLVSNDVVFNARLMAAGPSISTTPLVYYEVREGNDSLTRRTDTHSIQQRLIEMSLANAVLRRAGLHDHQASAAGHLRQLFAHAPFSAIALGLRLLVQGERVLPLDRARWVRWWAAKRTHPGKQRC